MSPTAFMGQVSAVSPAQAGEYMPPWWQIIGAFVLVIALLFIFLRFLNRLQAGRTGAVAGLLEKHNLGAGRSVEVLRFRDDVFTIYRSDSAAVLLDKQARAAYTPVTSGGAGHFPKIPLLDKLLRRQSTPD